MSRPQESVVVYGPQGVGITKHAKAIASALGLSFIVEEFHYTRAGNLYPKQDSLLIANYSPPFYWRGPVLTFAEAMQRVAKVGAA